MKRQRIRHKGTPPERFWQKVDRRGDDDCWLWRGATSRRGYGNFGVNGRSTVTSRYAWELTRGPIPKGLCVLHHCDNPPCCNPAHLFLGTRGDNARDMLSKGRHWSQTGIQPLRGQAVGNARLTEQAVRTIRRRYACGEPQGQIAQGFGVSRTAIGRVVRSEVWAWVA